MGSSGGMATGEAVILVDGAGRETGAMGKTEAHRRGLRHRAFSIFLFSPDGRCLMQRRALGKYHSGGLWSNACCGHPRPGEDVAGAAARRLREEIGVACRLEEAFALAYDLDVGGGMREAEYNHCFVGTLDAGAPLDPDPGECDAVEWRAIGAAEAGLAARPEEHSAWFALLFPKVLDHLRRGGAGPTPGGDSPASR